MDLSKTEADRKLFETAMNTLLRLRVGDALPQYMTILNGISAEFYKMVAVIELMMSISHGPYIGALMSVNEMLRPIGRQLIVKPLNAEIDALSKEFKTTFFQERQLGSVALQAVEDQMNSFGYQLTFEYASDSAVAQEAGRTPS